MQRLISVIAIFVIVISSGNAQSFNGFTEDESVLHKMNKQVGQFVHRFNMEEDQFGKVLPKNDSRFRNNEMRLKMLPGIFDNYNPRTSGNLKKYFIVDVTNENQPVYLDFLDNDWYAEVSATFSSKSGDENLILFLKIEQENLGTKWVLSNVYFRNLYKLFPKTDTADQQKYFLHPQSHELDFMNLHRALDNPQQIEYYASTNYQPDYLTLLFYLMKTGQLKFKQIDGVKFHFFQIRNWYFELSYFNRNDTNSGWLISNLLYVNEKEKQELIKTYKLCVVE
ncbi:MAG: hypothetical protein H8E34_09605 [Bacteroidetes bacterium]|nr:hypothetical protein [Bacteroidota bacterium]MBL6942808.1 hypothetical protein [Bacteroidales bacterium]